MRIDIISIFPEMFESPLHNSILKKAQTKQLVSIYLHSLRDYSVRKHKKVDDSPFGGGAGMVLQCEPIDRIISKLTSERIYNTIIYTSPDGEKLTQQIANELSLCKQLIILCGHYKGVDFRIREHLITREISIGDYVLSGGEIPAMVICDAIIRILPGVIGDSQSALSDSFQDDLLSHPIYTRPYNYKGWMVPDILLSGNKKKIKEWELEQSIKRTKHLRPNLLSDK